MSVKYTAPIKIQIKCIKIHLNAAAKELKLPVEHREFLVPLIFIFLWQIKYSRKISRRFQIHALSNFTLDKRFLLYPLQFQIHTAGTAYILRTYNQYICLARI